MNRATALSPKIQTISADPSITAINNSLKRKGRELGIVSNTSGESSQNRLPHSHGSYGLR